MAVWALTLGCLLATSAFAQEVEEQRRAVLEQQVRTQLGEYADDFPELRFMVLEGSPEEALGHLDSRLGRAPVSLDYEHPAEMRSHLVALALERVRIMLEANAPSASLLQPTADARPLCVITLAPWAIARDDRTATCHFLGLSPEQGELIAREAYLPCEDYLAFVLDHEAYHCLDAWHHGRNPYRLPNTGPPIGSFAARTVRMPSPWAGTCNVAGSRGLSPRISPASATGLCCTGRRITGPAGVSQGSRRIGPSSLN